ncbi:MAG TPA: two-component regulator propeller domain-containing protein, partial [Saprospiraceae bacterium]|nr:two-component regulator propeller domain-containing protein [Saprospiraceae bacterium]
MRIKLFIYLLLSFLMVKGQNSIYPFKNFTTDNGLPSNECHRILQDKKGYIWIVTDRGLCRYDGYNFKRYGKSEGLTDVAVMNMQLDKDENIWMTTISKNVFIYQVNSDSIVPYKYNHLLEKYKKHSNSLLDFHVDKDLNLFLIFWGHPIIKIDSTGILTINYEKVSDNFIKVIEIENKLKLNVVSIDTNFIFRPFYKLNNECSKFVSVGFLDVEHKKLTDLPYNNKSLLKGFTYGYKDKKTILLSFFDASYVFHKSKLVNYNFETIRSIIS